MKVTASHASASAAGRTVIALAALASTACGGGVVPLQDRDASVRVVARAEDAAKVTKAYLRDALGAVVGGTSVQLAETRAIGCSIKFR